jgi:hypothetical protein
VKLESSSPDKRPIIRYANPFETKQGASYRALLFLAFACSLLPMTAGLVTTMTFVVTRRVGLEALGFLVILIGVLLSVVGFFTTLTFAYRAWRSDRQWREWAPHALLAMFLLFANYPLAAGCVMVTEWSRIRVVNASGATISSFKVVDPLGSSFELGPIPPGKSVSKFLSLKGEGEVKFDATFGPAGSSQGVVTGTVAGYFTSGMTGVDRTVTANADGSFGVR